MLFWNSHRSYDFTLLTPGVPNWVDTQIARFDPKKRNIPSRKEYLSPHWETATHPYIRILQRKHKLYSLYKGLFRIIDRNPRTIFLDIDGTMKRISYLHLDPIHFYPDEETNFTNTGEMDHFSDKKSSLQRERCLTPPITQLSLSSPFSVEDAGFRLLAI